MRGQKVCRTDQAGPWPEWSSGHGGCAGVSLAFQSEGPTDLSWEGAAERGAATGEAPVGTPAGEEDALIQAGTMERKA